METSAAKENQISGRTQAWRKVQNTNLTIDLQWKDQAFIWFFPSYNEDTQGLKLLYRARGMVLFLSWIQRDLTFSPEFSMI